MDQATLENTDDQGWTPLQEAYIGKLMATYQANLHWLRQRFPRVFESVMEVPLDAPFQVDADGRVTLYYGGFKGGLREFTDLGRELFRLFDDPASRPSISVSMEHIFMPGAAAPHETNGLFDRPIEPEFRKGLVNKFLEMCPDTPDRLPMPNFGTRRLPIALVFGSGYGWHLDRLVDDYDLRHLILVDTDIKRLNTSLYFVDYVALEQKLMVKGFYFTMAYHKDTQRLSEYLTALLFNLWPPYFIQGAGLYFNDYDSEPAKTLWSQLRENLWRLYRGWGFMDDEILGLTHATRNALANHPLATKTGVVSDDAVAFVVGAGPSLDKLLPLMRQHQDRAIIISCGSGVTALFRAGIKPDLHLEIERTSETYVMFENPELREFIKDVPLVGLAILDPRVFTLTSKPLMFLKQLDLGASLLEGGKTLPRFRSNPTCTNGGVDFALRMGFKQVYLFGVDLGFREDGKHHASNSLYFDGDEKSAQLSAMMKQADQNHKSSKSAEGNFGGEVRTLELYQHSRDAMETSIAEFFNAKVFNLNDGMLIRGAQPLHAEDCVIPAPTHTKAEILEQVFAAFTRDYQGDMAERLGWLEEQVGAIAEDAHRLFERPITNKMDVADALFDFHQYLFDDQSKATQIFPMVRGSMLHLGRFFLDAMALTPNDEKASEYARYGFELLERFFRTAEARMAEMRREAEDHPSTAQYRAKH